MRNITMLTWTQVIVNKKKKNDAWIEWKINVIPAAIWKHFNKFNFYTWIILIVNVEYWWINELLMKIKTMNSE